MEPISLSHSAVAIIGALIGGLVGAITFLHRQVSLEKDRQIRRLESQMDVGLLPKIEAIHTEMVQLRAELRMSSSLGERAPR